MFNPNPDSPVTELHLGRSVSLDRAAELLNVSRRTIYNRIRDGRLQTIRTICGSQRVLVDSIEALLGASAGLKDRVSVASDTAPSARYPAP